MNNLEDFLKDDIHKLSIAPMLDVSNRYFWVFLRLLSKKVTFYTEMIHCDVLVRLPELHDELLGFDPIEKPLVFQFGGSDPKKLAQAA